MGPTLLTLGVILLLVGLIGQVKAREIDVGTQNPIVRVILGLIGLTFILIALYQSIPPFQGAITNTATLIPTSSAIVSETPFLSSPPTTSIPATTAAPDTAVPPTATFTPIPPTAAPIVISNTYNIAQYGGEPGTQRSIQLDYVITVRTVDLLQIEFSVPLSPPSSDVILHILWDDAEIFTTDHIGSVSGNYTTDLIDLRIAVLYPNGRGRIGFPDGRRVERLADRGKTTTYFKKPTISVMGSTGLKQLTRL